MHRGWLVASALILLAGALLYIPYAFFSVRGAAGGTVPGLIYGSIGFAMMIYAGALGARKKVRTWRLGRATWWMRGHLWIGFLSFPFILFHSAFRSGAGSLTLVLMILFIFVFLSGIFGAALQHFMPRYITERVVMETVYEQIEPIRRQLVQEAETIRIEINTAAEQEIERELQEEELQPSPSTAKKAAVIALVPDRRVSEIIDNFFDSQLRPYLLGHKPKTYALGDPAEAHALLQQLRVLVPATLAEKFADLEDLCEEKRQLERQRRLHNVLHTWLLVHIPCSYALLLLGAIHAVGALRF
jgi:hypothetical protein